MAETDAMLAWTLQRDCIVSQMPRIGFQIAKGCGPIRCGSCVVGVALFMVGSFGAGALGGRGQQPADVLDHDEPGL